MNKAVENLFKAKDVAVSAVIPLREKLMAHYGNVANTHKTDSSVVTELDKWAEHEIKAVLSTFDPSIGFLGEEHGAEGDTELRWVIDPIDGTEQYIRGIPVCSNMITLVDGTDLLIAVIYNFVTQDLFWAVKGGGAWLNDQRLHISERPLDRSFVDIGYNPENGKDTALFTSVLSKIRANVRYQTAGYTATLVASGKIEGRLTSSGKGGPWDYAPGALLITEAGGVITHLDGSPYDYMNTHNFVCGTPALVEFVQGLKYNELVL